MSSEVSNRCILIFIVAISSLTLLCVGLNTELCIGDEVHHFRLAKNILFLKERPVYDPLYGDPYLKMPGAMFYFDTPLWHTLMAVIWKIIGKVSFTAAQVYQTFYFTFLLIFTYLLGSKLYGEKEGLCSALITASLPMVSAFGIVFYLDVPAATFVVLSCLLVLEKRFLWAGISVGLGYLIKRNFLFFFPSFVFLSFVSVDKIEFKGIRKVIFVFIIPAVLLILLDLHFRYVHFHSLFFTKDPLIGPHTEILYQNPPFENYINSSIFNPTDIIKYFGVVILGLMLLYFFRRSYDFKDLFLWIPIISYLIGFFVIFKKGLDIRYLLPIVPLFSILGSKHFFSLKNRGFKMALLSMCAAQFFSVAFYVYAIRQISGDIKDGFQYIINHVPENAFVMYPEVNITEYTNRRMQWGRFQYMPYLFWQANETEAKNILLNVNKIEYIMINKTRIYDDKEIRHKGGYPQSFVDKLPEFSFLKLVFDNKKINIWKIE